MSLDHRPVRMTIEMLFPISLPARTWRFPPHVMVGEVGWDKVVVCFARNTAGA